MHRVLHDGHSPRPLQEKAALKVVPKLLLDLCRSLRHRGNVLFQLRGTKVHPWACRVARKDAWLAPVAKAASPSSRTSRSRAAWDRPVPACAPASSRTAADSS